MINYVVKISCVIDSTALVVLDDKGVGLESDMCLTIDEIVTDIISNRLSDDDKLYFKGCSDGDLIMEHLSFGMWIRNTYALWDSVNPLTEFDPDPLSNKHPDNVSSDVMRMLRETLNGKYTPDAIDNIEKFNDAMRTLGGE